ncbi:MAG: molybdenum cofactor guanylyltransferase [Haloarculaceae archaeon]
MHAGVIVAGGRSTRFGDRDKAVAELAGQPMIRRVADRLAGVIETLIVNCREDQLDAIRAAMAGYDHDVGYALDPQPDLGPVAGIETGLRAAASQGADYAVVVACDMPFVEPALLAHLFERAAGHDAAIPQLDDRWFQTTQAVYRTTAMADACEAALERGDRKVLAPLEDLEYVVVDEAEVREYAAVDTFENLNTRAEFEAAAERFS